ncbi:MAG TPA: short-chain fatty acyl-CoA regulator family protein [Vicinamibacterales bacterium]|nr:short-chain fatty acyl-CoA regulator family protein [Vicinamibacterales bacterium]
MAEAVKLGSKVRALRRKHRMTQAELAQRLGISPSYLNLIEHNRRGLSADLLVKTAEILRIDFQTLSPEHDARATAALLELFGDALFDGVDVVTPDVRECATAYPDIVQAVLLLYEAYRGARESVQTLAARLAEGGGPAQMPLSRVPNEEVSDLLQRHANHFPELEQGAEAFTRDANLDSDTLFTGLVSYLRRTMNVEVRILHTSEMRSALRRYDAKRRVLELSEVLRRGSRNFQLAHQVGLLTQSAVIDRIAADPLLTTDRSQALCRVALANYFASAVLMPYTQFLQAVRKERYDIELLGHRFRASFEQTCHRLTTLGRPGHEGIPFHMIRIDIAGNISKRFSASGLPFPRFAGACPRWNVFEAFLTPGMIRRQVSQMPDGATFFEVARTVEKESGGFRARRTQYAVALGCDIAYAREMVYAEGLDLGNREAVVPVGPTCRLCDRMDCEQRAYPSIQHPLTVNEHVRGVSFYAPLRE